jgi:hypothetical protein
MIRHLLDTVQGALAVLQPARNKSGLPHKGTSYVEKKLQGRVLVVRQCLVVVSLLLWCSIRHDMHG